MTLAEWWEVIGRLTRLPKPGKGKPVPVPKPVPTPA